MHDLPGLGGWATEPHRGKIGAKTSSSCRASWRHSTTPASGTWTTLRSGSTSSHQACSASHRRNLSVHHNVVFNCGHPNTLSDSQSSVAGLGIVLKGDGHVLFANTLWAANASDLCIAACAERRKSYLTQWPRTPVQNCRSRLFNSAAHGLDGLCGCANATAVGETEPQSSTATSVRCGLSTLVDSTFGLQQARP